MADKKYTYSGPLTGVTFRGAAGEADRDVVLADGATVTLPEAHPFTRRLKALGRLTESPDSPAPVVAKGTKKVKEEPANAS